MSHSSITLLTTNQAITAVMKVAISITLKTCLPTILMSIHFTNLIDQDFQEMDFIFIEIPSILHYPTPVRMMRKVHFALFVARSNRPWSVAETNVLKNFKKTVLESTETECIANGVKLDVLETIIGEIPKRRSFIRRFVKRMLKLQFHSSRKFR